MKRIAYAAALLAVCTGLATAQGPTRPGPGARPGMMGRDRAPRVMGEITRISGSVYTVKGMRGNARSVTIPANTPVMKGERQKASLKDLKVGVSIAATLKAPGTGTSVTATRVVIMPLMQAGKVLGITSSKITIKTAAGKSVGYTINAKTRQPKGERAIKVGDEVIVVHKGSVAEAIRHAGGRGMRGPGGMRPGGMRPGAPGRG